MKLRNIYIFFLAFILSSCVDSILTSNEPVYNTIKAVIENNETKTSVTDEGSFTWSSGDQIWLHTTKDAVIGTLASGASTPNASFNYGAYMGEMTGKAIYPYNANHSINGNELTFSLPDTYNLGASTDNTNAAMYAELVDGSLSFKHLAGVMRFSFKNVPVGANQFKITLDKKVNGSFTVDLSETTPTIQTAEASSDSERSITFNFNALETVSDLKIYVPLPVGEYTSLALEINSETENLWSYSKTITNNVKHKSLVLMPAVTMSGSIDGGLENGEVPYVKFEDGSSVMGTGVFSANDNNWSCYLDTNLEKDEIVIERPENNVWLYAYTSTTSDQQTKLVINVVKNRGFSRSATIKIKPANNPDNYIELKVAQDSGIEEYMKYSSYSGGGSLTKVDDYTVNVSVPAIDSDGVPEWIDLDTNIPDYIISFPENDSWLQNCGTGNSTYPAVVLVPDNNYGGARSSVIHIISPHTKKVYFTVNLYQEGNPDAFTSLSTSGTANSYIISEAGAYSILPYKGNSTTSIGNCYSAEVLWESYGTNSKPATGSLIKSVEYLYGNICFETADTFTEGNAVIAAKDRNGNILWSWHIWLTDEPKEHVYNNNAGVMMDRNLGALSADKSDLSAGLLYQWGRKDPFLGAVSMQDNNASEANSSATWPSPIASDESTGTINYAIQNPMTFITSNSNNSDWYYSSDLSTDKTRWASTKTIYDPCPVGWRVPDGNTDGIWAKAGNFTSGSSTWDYSYHTKSISCKDSNGNSTYAYYPAAPCLICSTGKIYEPEEAAGWSGHYWSCTTEQQAGYKTRFYNLNIEYPGYVTNVNYNQAPAYGYSVRCQKEASN